MEKPDWVYETHLEHLGFHQAKNLVVLIIFSLSLQCSLEKLPSLLTGLLCFRIPAMESSKPVSS